VFRQLIYAAFLLGLCVLIHTAGTVAMARVYKSRAVHPDAIRLHQPLLRLAADSCSSSFCTSSRRWFGLMLTWPFRHRQVYISTGGQGSLGGCTPPQPPLPNSGTRRKRPRHSGRRCRCSPASAFLPKLLPARCRSGRPPASASPGRSGPAGWQAPPSRAPDRAALPPAR
jgi:hypothetical protein